MEINLRNVPFSEDLLFFIRRCAGESGDHDVRTAHSSDLEVRLRHIEVPSSVYEVQLRRSRGRDDVIVLETDPDVFLAVRNAFEILKARDRRDRAISIRPAPVDVTTDAHT